MVKRKNVKKRQAKSRSPTSDKETADMVEQDDEQSAAKREFARRIQMYMTRNNMSQSDLARKISERLPAPARGQKQNRKFGRDRISHYFNGKNLPRAEVRQLFADVLGVPIEELWPGAVKFTPEVHPLRIKTLDNGRVFMTMNRAMSAETAFKIMRLVEEDDKA